MRLKHSVYSKYYSKAEFWRGACRYEGKCCYPQAAEYQKICDEIWAAWREAGGRGKGPAFPPETVLCEKCRYADKTLGRFQGKASETVISRHVDGTVPVPLKGRKKVWLDNVSPKQLDAALADISPELEAFAISGSPGIRSFSFLENFPKLRKAYIWWNNKAEALWDLKKTPKLVYLYLDSTRFTDLSPLRDAQKLKYLFICSGSGDIPSLRPLKETGLEFVVLSKKVIDMDIRPLIDLPTLRYLHLHFNLFDMRSYAMFEARRPDVATTFFEGLDGFEEDFGPAPKHKMSFVGLVGKRQGMADSADTEKQEKHRQKFLALKEALRSTDFVPDAQPAQPDTPAALWREAAEDGSDIHTLEEIKEIESILDKYAADMRACKSKSKAKAVLEETMEKIAAFDRKTGFLETEEREELYGYLVGLFPSDWYEELEKMLSEAER